MANSAQKEEHHVSRERKAFIDLLHDLGLRKDVRLTLKDYSTINQEQFADTRDIVNRFFKNLSARNPHSVRDLSHQHLEEKNIGCYDILHAIIERCDPFLLQEVLQGLFDCKQAVPVIMPDILQGKLIVYLWGLRGCYTVLNNSQSNNFKLRDVTTDKFAIISAVRLNTTHVSKTIILNDLVSSLSELNAPPQFSDIKSKRNWSMGVIEGIWCFSKEEKREFAFLNLRGDGLEHLTQVDYCTNVSSLVIVFVENLNDSQVITILERIAQKCKVIAAIASTESETSDLPDISQVDFIKVSGKSDSQLSDELCRKVCRETEQNCLTRSLEDCIEKCCNLEVEVDEKSEKCLESKKAVEQILNKVVSVGDDYGKDLFALQQCWKHEELTRVEIGADGRLGLDHISSVVNTFQSECILSEEMKAFIEALLTDITYVKYFLKWVDIKMASSAVRNTSPDLEFRTGKKKVNSEAQKTKVTNKNSTTFNKCLSSSSRYICYGDFFREVGQIVESSNNGNFDSVKICKSVARLLLDGHRFEIMENEVGNISIRWMSQIFSELDKLTNYQASVRVVTCLGTPRSGKSTLLNQMFGLNFPAGIGNYTRGIQMQLATISSRVCEEKQELLLILDTQNIISKKKPIGLETTMGNYITELLCNTSDILLINIHETDDIGDIIFVCNNVTKYLKTVGGREPMYLLVQHVHNSKGEMELSTKLLLAELMTQHLQTRAGGYNEQQRNIEREDSKCEQLLSYIPAYYTVDRIRDCREYFRAIYVLQAKLLLMLNEAKPHSVQEKLVSSNTNMKNKYFKRIKAQAVKEQPENLHEQQVDEKKKKIKFMIVVNELKEKFKFKSIFKESGQQKNEKKCLSDVKPPENTISSTTFLNFTDCLKLFSNVVTQTGEYSLEKCIQTHTNDYEQTKAKVRNDIEAKIKTVCNEITIGVYNEDREPGITNYHIKDIGDFINTEISALRQHVLHFTNITCKRKERQRKVDYMKENIRKLEEEYMEKAKRSIDQARQLGEKDKRMFVTIENEAKCIIEQLQKDISCDTSRGDIEEKVDEIHGAFTKCPLPDLNEIKKEIDNEIISVLAMTDKDVSDYVNSNPLEQISSSTRGLTSRDDIQNLMSLLTRQTSVYEEEFQTIKDRVNYLSREFVKFEENIDKAVDCFEHFVTATREEFDRLTSYMILCSFFLHNVHERHLIEELEIIVQKFHEENSECTNIAESDLRRMLRDRLNLSKDDYIIRFAEPLKFSTMKSKLSYMLTFLKTKFSDEEQCELNKYLTVNSIKNYNYVLFESNAFRQVDKELMVLLPNSSKSTAKYVNSITYHAKINILGKCLSKKIVSVNETISTLSENWKSFSPIPQTESSSMVVAFAYIVAWAVTLFAVNKLDGLTNEHEATILKGKQEAIMAKIITQYGPCDKIVASQLCKDLTKVLHTRCEELLAIRLREKVMQLPAFVLRRTYDGCILQSICSNEDFYGIIQYVNSRETLIKKTMWNFLAVTLNAKDESVIENNVQEIVRNEYEMVMREISCDQSSENQNPTIGEWLIRLRNGLQKQCKSQLPEVGLLMQTISSNFSDLLEFEKTCKELLGKAKEEHILDICLPEKGNRGETKAWLISVTGNLDDDMATIVLACREQCPFCGIPCDYFEPNHGEHNVKYHIPIGIKGGRERKSGILCSEMCREVLQSQGVKISHESDTNIPFQKILDNSYPTWPRSHYSLDFPIFWKYIFATYNKEFAEYYECKPGGVPNKWKHFTKEDALASLRTAFNLKERHNILDE